jgi:hypothetical protein
MDEFEAGLDLCNKSSPGMDGINFNIQGLGFFNGMLQTGEIPEKLYLAKVVPILKPGKSPASYRPISLIGYDRKLM